MIEWILQKFFELFRAIRRSKARKIAKSTSNTTIKITLNRDKAIKPLSEKESMFDSDEWFIVPEFCIRRLKK